MLDLDALADTRMRALSGGEQRRVDLALTLMGRPEVVMLDEPTTGLDPESRRRVWRLIQDLQADGVTVLLTTHYLEEAETLSDRISIMAAGRIVREGTVASLVADHPSTISFRTPAATLPSLGDASVTSQGDMTTIEISDLQSGLTGLLRWAEDERVRLEDLRARSASLESVFLEIAEHPGETGLPGETGHPGKTGHPGELAAPDDVRPEPTPIGVRR